MSAQNTRRPPLKLKRFRPAIRITNKQLRESSEEAWKALKKANAPPKLFVRSGELIRVRRDEGSRPIVEVASEAILRNMLTEAANFFRATSSSEISVNPPAYLAKDILAKESWDVPVFEGLVEAPIVRANGSILDTPGYDPASGLYYRLRPIWKYPL